MNNVVDNDCWRRKLLYEEAVVEGGSCRRRRKLPWKEDPRRLLAEKLAAVVLRAAEGSLESSNRLNRLVST
jgi:hypothetical protein